MWGLDAVGEHVVTATRCKACNALVVRGASHCAHCGSRQGMPFGHKLLLGVSVVLIGGLFFIAARPPNDADLEYRPLAPVLDSPQGAVAPTTAAPQDDKAPPAAGRDPDEGAGSTVSARPPAAE